MFFPNYRRYFVFKVDDINNAHKNNIDGLIAKDIMIFIDNKKCKIFTNTWNKYVTDIIYSLSSTKIIHTLSLSVPYTSLADECCDMSGNIYDDLGIAKKDDYQYTNMLKFIENLNHIETLEFFGFPKIKFNKKFVNMIEKNKIKKLYLSAAFNNNDLIIELLSSKYLEDLSICSIADHDKLIEKLKFDTSNLKVIRIRLAPANTFIKLTESLIDVARCRRILKKIIICPNETLIDEEIIKKYFELIKTTREISKFSNVPTMSAWKKF